MAPQHEVLRRGCVSSLFKDTFNGFVCNGFIHCLQIASHKMM